MNLGNWQNAVDRTVSGLGYELVDTERSAGGMLRVYIDRVAGDPQGEFVTVDDCEKVTRQLQHVLEVENFDYSRLEVSSPGLDRPLKKASDYARFAGAQVDLTLKLPFQGRKKYRGELQAHGAGWRLVLAEEAADAKKPAKGAAKPAAPAAAAPDRALDFSLEEVREARLVPVLDFKGRRAAASGSEVDGGRER